jgi:hypothetical protein
MQFILDNIYKSIDNKRTTATVSLDISAAFDTVNHETLLHRSETKLGEVDKSLSWLCWYLSQGKQYIKNGCHCSETLECSIGISQSSILWPILFATYTSPVGQLIASHGIEHHQYAHDTQLILAMTASTIQADLLKLETCSQTVKRRFAENNLLLNADKSEVMFIGSSAQLHAVSTVSQITVVGPSLPLSSQSKTLGVIVDLRLTLDPHVSAVCM